MVCADVSSHSTFEAVMEVVTFIAKKQILQVLYRAFVRLSGVFIVILLV